MNLSEHEKIGPQILQGCEIERKMASKSKECEGFEHDHIWFDKHLYTFCIVCTFFVCIKNMQRPFQLASGIDFVG